MRALGGDENGVDIPTGNSITSMGMCTDQKRKEFEQKEGSEPTQSPGVASALTR